MTTVGRWAALTALTAWVGAAWAGAAFAAEPVLVRCGREFQAAKAAGTLDGVDWNRYRVDCATRLKTDPAVVPAQAVASAPVAPAPSIAAPFRSTATPPATAAPASGGGRAAMNVRQKQCGAEWRAQKATLVVQTPGLTWPRYWSQCNTRLKAAGG